MKVKEKIARLFYPYGSVRTILRGPLQGYKYVVGPSMGMTYALGADANDQEFLSEEVSEGSVVFDIGANRGQLTLLFAHVVGKDGRVIAFEPVEELAERIHRNAKLNALRNVDIVTAAASFREGKAEFDYSTEHSTQGMLKETEPTYTLSETETVTVQTTPLDEVARERKAWPDMIKIDVEGGAGAVLKGAQQVLAREPDVFIEQHGPEEQKAVKDELIDRGYTVRTLNGDLVQDPTDGWYNPLWCTIQ
ncbi:MAG: FkbM family methyltransferase [Candidatus Paceibacteria bacterium]